MKFHNDLLLKAARGEQVERTPVWLMRQAGRILPEYRKVRNSVKDFKELVETPQLAAEVTIQPVDILGVDAAIIFSDILVVPEAMGLPYEMIENKGPWFEKTISSEKDVQELQTIQQEGVGYVNEAIRITKNALLGRVPLIGFAGAPWTILAYMVEGSGSKTFSKAKKILYTQPGLAHQLLEKVTISTIHYLLAQIAAGADIVQLFDSWAGILGPQQYQIFCLPYLDQICKALKAENKNIPIIIFAKGAFFSRKEFGKLDCDVVGLDWCMDIKESRELIGTSKTLQGNMDPCLLYADFKVIEKETIHMLRAFGSHRHIANLGHGIYPDVEKEKAKHFIDTVKAFRF